MMTEWTWSQLLAGLIGVVASGLIGGFIGGWLVAFKMGRWAQHVEDRVGAVERALESGSDRVRLVPIVQAKLDAVIDEIKTWRADLRENMKQYVTLRECDRRHDADN